jgi:hypothetical protein
MQSANQVIAEVINGGEKISEFTGGNIVGTKREVWNGSALRTSGGLRKKDLMYNSKRGRIVSKRKHEQGKKALMYLHQAGYKAKKGEFRLFSKSSRRSRSKRSRRGGLKAGSDEENEWTLL